MRKVLIISPYFPPDNAADMQRVRMSLPYFKKFGWIAEVVAVSPEFTDVVKDPDLLQTIPEHVVVHRVRALPKSYTSRVGLGSIGIRALWYYQKCVKQIIEKQHFDLIYFSTTQFPVVILGRFWKKKYNIPYVIDFQDPWHSEYYIDKPKAERPPKYFLVYHMNKYLEAFAMKRCDGLIAVSQSYIIDLKTRYRHLKSVPASVITFGAFHSDFELVKNHLIWAVPAVEFNAERINLLYLGRGGSDMAKALTILFKAFKTCLENDSQLFSKVLFTFMGTSYAPNGEGIPSILPVAKKNGVDQFVKEYTDRTPFFSGISTLLSADGLIIPGSDDAQYTASKIFPYILSHKPFFGVFHAKSSVVRIVSDTNTGEMITLNSDEKTAYEAFSSFIHQIVAGTKRQTNMAYFDNFSAENMTRKQCLLFDQVINCT